MTTTERLRVAWGALRRTGRGKSRREPIHGGSRPASLPADAFAQAGTAQSASLTVVGSPSRTGTAQSASLMAVGTMTPVVAAQSAVFTAVGARRVATTMAIGAMLLAACQTTPTRPMPSPVQGWDARRMELQQRDKFGLNGRVAVAAAGQGFNARLRWEQVGPQANLALDGPLGVGGVHVSSNGTQLSVQNSKGERLDSDAARTELTSRLGFEPPLQSLRYWILGAPDPTHPAEETLDADQRLISLRQDGWQIDYAKYVAVGDGWYPERLTLQRGDVRVKLIVDNWDA